MRIRPVVAVLFLLVLTPAFAEDDPLAGARRHHEMRDHRLAEEALLLRLADVPDDVEAMKLLIEVYLVTNRIEDAGIILEKALPLGSEDPMLRATVWEVALYAKGWTPEAIAEVRAEVEAFLAATPKDGAAWRLTAAYAGFNLINDRERKADLRRMILARFPDDPPEVVEGDLFEAIIVERDIEKRTALIREFTRLFPDSNQVNYVREILAYTLRDDLERLEEEFRPELKRDPDNRRIHAALGRWLLQDDAPQPERALIHLERAVELLASPRDMDRPELSSDEDWARMILQTRGRYHAWLARARFLMGDYREAVDLASMAIADGANDPGVHLTQGRAAKAVGETKLALDAFAHAAAAGASPEAEAELRDMIGSPLRPKLQERLGPAPLFTDATGAAGLGGVRGGRISIVDANGDGRADLLIGGSRLYLGTEDHRFTPAPAFPKVPGARGGIFADLDNDGDLDLLVFRTDHPLILANDGKGIFTDRTPASLKSTEKLYTEAAAVLDFDRDGLLDLYLANYERPPHPPYARGTADLLFRNIGKLDFADASGEISDLSLEPMCGRGIATGDFDDDGDTDLHVANYRLDPDVLLVNEDGKLKNRARARGVEGECDKGYFGHGIGPAFGDLDGDGHLDLVVGNLAHPRYIGFSDVTRVFLSSGPPAYTFRDVFRQSGIRYEETHSNASLGDVDLDGDLDLYLTSVYRGRKSFLYLNDGQANFRDVTWLASVRADNGWGSAFGDLDNDGDLDLIVGSGSGIRFYRNTGPTGGFVGLRLSGDRDMNGSAVGTRVTLTGAGPDQVREIAGGTGTGCQDSPALRFGVGSAKGPFTLTIRWPDGRIQRILGIRAGKLYRLVAGENPVQEN
jgi:enediyne biosynthesis protein E4